MSLVKNQPTAVVNIDGSYGVNLLEQRKVMLIREKLLISEIFQRAM
jgi:hypothetical protein